LNKEEKLKNLKLNTLIFALILVALVLCYFLAGYFESIPVLGSIGIGTFVIFSVVLFWSLNKKPKQKGVV